MDLVVLHALPLPHLWSVRFHPSRTDYLHKFGPFYKENYGARSIFHSYDPQLFAVCSHQDGKTPFRPILPLLATANKRDGYNLGEDEPAP